MREWGNETGREEKIFKVVLFNWLLLWTILDSIGYPPGNLEECTPYFYPQEMGSLRPLSNSRFLLMFTSIVIKFPELLGANICGLSGIP